MIIFYAIKYNDKCDNATKSNMHMNAPTPPCA